MPISTEIVDVTPKMATQLLDRNTKNRKLRENRVESYSEAMRRGEWIFNGDAIRIAKDGTLLDGQHRLAAIERSGKAIKQVLVSGLKNEAQETMDRPKTRTVSDMLELRGEPNSALLGSTSAALFAYSKIGNIYPGNLNHRPTAQQILKFLEDHPDIRSHLYPERGETLFRLLSPTVTTSLNYLFSITDQEDAKDFWHLLTTGEDIQPGNPVYILRERLIREQLKPQGRISPTVKGALTVKAFNYWREGRSMFSLRWSGGGKRAEPFPRVVECPLVPEIDQIDG